MKILPLLSLILLALTRAQSTKKGMSKGKGMMTSPAATTPNPTDQPQPRPTSPPTPTPEPSDPLQPTSRNLKDEFPFGSNRDKVSYHFCNICRNGRIPRKNNIMNFLYIGTGTCMDYWLNGQHSRLPTHMCSVIQYYSHSTCGCDIQEPNKLLIALADKLLNKDMTRSLQTQEFIPGHLLDIVIAYDEPIKNASDVLNGTREVCLKT